MEPDSKLAWKKLSQEQLSFRSGLHRTYVGSIEPRRNVAWMDDFSDWQPQRLDRPNGWLADYVYKSKLLVVPGDYRLNAPVSFLPGTPNDSLPSKSGIHTVHDLTNYNGNDAKICSFKKALHYKDQTRKVAI